LGIGTKLPRHIGQPPGWFSSLHRFAAQAKSKLRFFSPRRAHACSRSTAQGKRDLAIGLCLARLGLRAGEVAALVLEDINWRQGVFRLRQSKNGQPAQLPLLTEVGESIANYLREALWNVAEFSERRFLVGDLSHTPGNSSRRAIQPSVKVRCSAMECGSLSQPAA
jgi:integrase